MAEHVQVQSPTAALNVAGTREGRLGSIAIVGGGTAGWVAASVLTRALTGAGYAITVIESPDIGTVGVGEATIPPIIDLLRFLDINQEDFVRHTQATYKLGIKFIDWRNVGDSYWHPFGTCGAPINRRPFHHAWHKARTAGVTMDLQDYSLCTALGDAGRFRFPDPAGSPPVAGLRYALHFDAGLVAKYLRGYAERLGVVRREGTVRGATLKDNGFIDELAFEDGSRLAADLYIDCSGFRGLLIEQTLKTGYLDWSAMLPCDRAVALPTLSSVPPAPYTRAWARTAGWQWRIPLQHRVGNGYVYASAHLSDSAALEDLQATVGEEAAGEPRFLRFVTGRRRLFWNRNCIALGLASGFIEPLESTSIHLAISGVYNLLEHFPDRSFNQANIDQYNGELIEEYERVRDFVVLHYCLTQRTDTALWQYCRDMLLPQSLQERIDLYRASGRIRPKPGELFTDLSWFYIFEGMGIVPESYDPLMDAVPVARLREMLAIMVQATHAAARGAPTHESFFPARAGHRSGAHGGCG
jgi:tryptophan 7-halogenase